MMPLGSALGRLGTVAVSWARRLTRLRPSKKHVLAGWLALTIFFPSALVAVLCVSPRAGATERIIGLSHAGDPAQVRALIAGEALALPPGDTLTLYDALAQKKIASIAIPDDPTKARPERKVEYIVPAMAALKAYLAAPGGNDPALINASPFLDAIGPFVTDHSAEGVRILLLGSPWFTAPGSLEKKDYIGSFPSDGLILADRSKSPVGTRGKHDLEGATVDFCYVTEAAHGFLTVEHKERVERAWSLLIQQRGGQLTTFSDDLKSCFGRYAEPKPPAGHQFAIDPKDATMNYFYRPQDIAPRMMNAQPVKTGDASVLWSASAMRAEGERFNRPARTTPPSTRTGPAWIGIQWKDPIDLDLYVKCAPSSPFLFFAHQLSAEGRHNFDYRGGTGTEFETVNLTAPCADISKAKVFVNFFAGSVRASPKGVFAIEFDGGLYKTDFVMPAHSGNQGAGGSEAGTMGGPYWVKIDLPAVLHLNARAAAARPLHRATR